MYQNTEEACHSAPKEPKSSLAGTGAELCPHLRYYKSVALSYHNGTTTPCLSLSLPVSLEVLGYDKSAVLSPRVPPCRSLSLSGSDYESEGRRFESCRARPYILCKPQLFKKAGALDKETPACSVQLHCQPP